MKTLIADDDLTSRLLLEGYLKIHSEIQVVVNGQEAVEAARQALEAGKPFNLICLDINMPELNGQQALNAIRQMEAKAGIEPKKRAKIFMTTGLGDKANVVNAVQQRCDYYLIKPFSQITLLQKLHDFRLIFSPKEWEVMECKLPPDLSTDVPKRFPRFASAVASADASADASVEVRSDAPPDGSADVFTDVPHDASADVSANPSRPQ